MTRPAFLIAYATREGQTKKVADEIAQVGREMGVDVDVMTVKDFHGPLPDSYDGVLLGGSIHVGELEKELIEFARQHDDELEALGASLFVVCLTARDDKPESRDQIAGYFRAFSEKSGWHPALMTAFAGAIRYSQYGFFKKRLMRRIAEDTGAGTDVTRDYEYTDWKSVDAFAEDVIGLAIGGEVVPANAGRERPSGGSPL